MNRPIGFIASVLSMTIAAAACGGAANPSAAPSSAVAAPASATVTPTVAAATATSTASPAPAYAGVGAAVAKLSEVTTTMKTSPVHMGFIGDERDLAPGTYTETLTLVTLQPGGRTVSHKHGGTEVVIVIEGSVDINMGAAGRAALNVGQSATVPAGTPLQASNSGTGVAKFLAFFMTPEGQPFQTNLTTVP